MRVALSLALLLASCSTPTPTLPVGPVLIDGPAVLDGHEQARDGLRAGVGERLRDDATIRFVPGSSAATHLVQLELAVLEGTGSHWLVHVRLKALREGPSYEASATAPASVDLVPGVLRLFDRAWVTLGRERALDGATDEQLIAALLAESDPDVRLFVIERLGDRRTHAAVDPLAKLLATEPRTDVKLRAVGALVAIGDPRGVEPIIALTHRKDSTFIVPLIYALAHLGGPSAEGYLVTVASGHPDTTVRHAAREALTEMARRGKKGPLTQPAGSR
ncbi:MAG: HEAT repeat domain-containing protein [Myxococcota bacterium]